jgi:preprotein translocase subunit SecA
LGSITFSDRVFFFLDRFPMLGLFMSSFFPESRRQRVEDEIYKRDHQSFVEAIEAEEKKIGALGDELLCRKTTEFRDRLRRGFQSQIRVHLEELKRRLSPEGKLSESDQALVDQVARGEVDHLTRRRLKLLEDGEAFFNTVREIEQSLLEELKIEAFAMVREACRRHVGKSWDVTGREIRWEMIPFDVQLMGANELHSGKVIEMATGEGKTLVALMPLYLNGLLGHGVHLVTVNDYLAKRDSEWMGHILEFLGLTVGCLDKTEPGSRERHAAYRCDVTYGTNNEFGFDYLRDNMAMRSENVVQRGHHCVIIDEVDSILIDEARTPLIISGPVDRSTHQYDRLKPLVADLVRKQNQRIAELADKGVSLLKEGDSESAGEHFMWCEKGAPKHPRVSKLFQEPQHKKLSLEALNRWTMDKRMPELDEILYFTLDEKGHSCDLTEIGRQALAPHDPDMFMVFDLVEEFSNIEATETDPAKRSLMKAEARRKHGERSEELHNISQLLRAYMLYEKDVEYVVQENRVIIVDEFTGRPMPGRRWSDGLHQAVEAKEGVHIERESQTLGTITIQNYFRLYEKLSGMTGTAETEKNEFDRVYKIGVQRVPTNRPVRRVDHEDTIHKTKREKYNAIIEEIEFLNSHGMPVLVGTVSVDVSETLARFLKRQKIHCNVLNAKQHQSEAEIVEGAGRKGAVTIATNMAGRGTDIKLGPGVIRCQSPDYQGPRCSVCPWNENGAEVDDELPPCGLQVIGSERHESRRIDRQLRGRAGRQGDPGSSRFFLSFEDELLRLFLPERAVNLVTRLGKMEEGDQIESRWLTRQIGMAQGKLEAVNTDRRKKTLEYDDVMNKQRDVIYARRAQALFATPGECRSIVLETCSEALETALGVEFTEMDGRREETDVAGFVDWAQRMVPYVDMRDLADREPHPDARGEAMQAWRDEFLLEAMERVGEAYDKKATMLGPDITLGLTRYVVLQTIDQDWRDHLLAMDELRAGINLRGYAQVNPLHEYQQEAYRLFEEMMENINRELFERWFRLQVVQQRPGAPPGAPPPGIGQMTEGRGQLPGGAPGGPGGMPPGAVAGGQRPPKPKPFKREIPKVKPNDPCPCGSGKKYKKCHGRLQPAGE